MLDIRILPLLEKWEGNTVWSAIHLILDDMHRDVLLFSVGTDGHYSIINKANKYETNTQ